MGKKKKRQYLSTEVNLPKLPGLLLVYPCKASTSANVTEGLTKQVLQPLGLPQVTQSDFVQSKHNNGLNKITFWGFSPSLSSYSIRYHRKTFKSKAIERTWEPEVLKNTAHSPNYIKFMLLWHNYTIFKITAIGETTNRDVSRWWCTPTPDTTRLQVLADRGALHYHPQIRNIHLVLSPFLSPSDKTPNLAISLILMKTWHGPMTLEPSSALFSHNPA